MATMRNKNRKQISRQQALPDFVMPGVASQPPVAGSANMQTKAGRASSGSTSQATDRAFREAGMVAGGFNTGPPVGPPTVVQERNQKLVFVGVAGLVLWAFKTFS